jgi:hypothetical protein
LAPPDSAGENAGYYERILYLNPGNPALDMLLEAAE